MTERNPADITVDLLIVGSGTGMAAALAASELGLSSLIIEKTDLIGGSTARSGGAFWLPANSVLKRSGSTDSFDKAHRYLRAVVGVDAPAARFESFLRNGPATLDMLARTTPMTFMWAEGYSDYHPEEPGGSSVGRTCECLPFDSAKLGAHRKELRPGVMKTSFPMPVTGADYRWLNLMTRKPLKAVPRILKRAAQGLGGLIIGRRYVAGGQALAAGMFAGVLKAGIPYWTSAALKSLRIEDGRITGAEVTHNGRTVSVTTRHGVILAAGGFDHDMEWRRKFQSEHLDDHISFGSEGNTGDAIRLAQDIGADITLMDQSWWFPAFAPLPGAEPLVMLAERSLPGCVIVNQDGARFVNEACDYMSFGQRVLELERSGDRVEEMWLIFDQRYRDSYLMAAELFPRMPIPKTWYEGKIAYRSDDLAGLARQIPLPTDRFLETMQRFNRMAAAGVDADLGRGQSAYDRYYGDPTVTPNPNLRPVEDGPYYAVKMVLSDLGTCGGLRADERARVLREDGSPIDGLYAIGNTAANVFGASYPGAGATIGQGLVFGYIAAHDAAQQAAARQS